MSKNSIKIISIFTVLLLTISIIILSVKITLNFSPLYSYDIKHLSLAKEVNLPEEKIKDNYFRIIDYINSSSIDRLVLPNFKMSQSGELHFMEVKKIFQALDKILYMALPVLIVFIILLVKNRSFSFLKQTSITLVAVPLLLAVPCMINFSATFDTFHKIFFNNDFWEFNPDTDPVINILPEEYFFHCAVLIMSLIVIASIILLLLYRHKKKKVWN